MCLSFVTSKWHMNLKFEIISNKQKNLSYISFVNKLYSSLQLMKLT